MKKLTSLYAGIVIIFLVIVLQGCQKLIDKYLPIGHNDYKACRITHIVTQLDEEVIGTVEYNEAKDPISLTYNKEKAYQLYLRYMYYDSQNRLSIYKVKYDSSLDVEDHRYGYSGDRIISDTGTFRMTGYTVILSTFEYDSKGRIVVENRKIIDFEGSPDTWEQLDPIIFKYDSNDNLVVDHEYSYDNKVNFRRTNRVWMFITRNYSLNNLQGPVEYNEQGLP